MVGTLLAAMLEPTISTNVNALIESRMSSFSSRIPVCLERFVDYDHFRGSGRLLSNTNFWLSCCDFSCVSPWNSYGGRLRAGTAISKRHVIFSKHFPIPVGTRIAFVGVSGEITYYSIIATKGLAHCDIMIGLLNYELTPDVHPAKILPANIQDSVKDGWMWPIVTFTQHEQTYLSEYFCSWDSESKCMDMNNRRPKASSWRVFGGELVVGDSGNPAFLLYGHQPILLYCIRNGGVGQGPYLHHFRIPIQTAMDALCSGYTLESVDFSRPDSGMPFVK